MSAQTQVVEAPVRTDVAVWFDIPAQDFERAVTFYESILDTKLKREKIADSKIAIFPYERPGVSGCVIKDENYRPSADGAVVYLKCDGRLDAVLEKIEKLGGRRAGPMVDLPPGMGRFAHVIDTEGNRVGLHSY